MIEKYILSNGLKILYKKTNTKSVTIAVCVKAGCVYEPDELMGVSHFLEHMLFNGTKNRSQNQILTAIEDLGGNFNASTSSDMTVYTIKILGKHFDVALDMLSDIIINSIFPKDFFDREKGVVIDEINMVYDMPKQYLFVMFKDILFQNHPVRKRILGTKDTIAKLTRKQLFDYYKKYYVPNNMIISVAGKVENVFNKIEEKFKSEVKEELIFSKIKTQENINHSILEKRDISQSYLGLGYVIPSRKENKSLVFDVIGAVLGRRQSGWIIDEIRNKRGLAYEAGVHISSSIDYGYMYVYVNSHKKNFELIKKIILEQFLRIQTLTEIELENAKNYIKGDFILENEDTEELAEAIAFFELCCDSKDFENYVRKIKKITLSEVKDTAKKYLTQNYSQAIIQQEN